MKITVITVCFNSAKTIEETIRSVVRQTYSGIEHIVVDGASTDGTLNVIEQHRDKLPFSDQLPTLDPPTHTNHRSLLMRLITPKRLRFGFFLRLLQCDWSGALSAFVPPDEETSPSAFIHGVLTSRVEGQGGSLPRL